MRKVLVIRLSSLGDVVLTLPVFKTLRQTWPDAQISALTKEAYADVLRGDPHIDQLLILKPGESIFSLVRRVRHEHFDVVIDLHANIRSRLVSFLSGATLCVRYAKAALARRLYVRWRLSAPELQEHVLDRYLQTLRNLGIQTPALTQETPPYVKNILVVQTAFLGDAVLTLPFLNALHGQYPKAMITVFCTPEIADVFGRQPAVSDRIVFDKRGKDRSWSAVWSYAHKLRDRKFQIAFLPHRSFKSAFLAWLAAIPRRIGFDSSQGRWLLTDVVPFQWGVHDADRNLALLRAVGVQLESGELSLRPDPKERQRIDQRLEVSGIAPEDRILGINAGSVWATKRWLPEGFAAVADRAVRELGLKIIFFGGPKDQENVAQIMALMREPALNWAGQTNLRELMAAVSRCDIFLTNDSGPMHIAVACQVPTVAIFGPTTRELGFFPYGSGHTVIEKDLPCRPCGLHGAKKCPLEHFQCMKLITSEEVFQSVALKAGTKPARVALPYDAVNS